MANPILLAVTLALGQSSVPSETRVQAIVGARVEVGDGRVLERATLVIRNGVIVALAPDAPVPAGAQTLDGKGLTLTPGFIDAWTDKGTALPEAKPDPDAAVPAAEYASAAMREANRKGIRPEIEARNYLNVTEDYAKAYRNAGFTTAMVVPDGGYIAGVGTLVNLSGRPMRDSIVVPETALAIDFDGNAAGGTYPGSLLGRIAHVRQTFEDARGLRAASAAFRAGGTQRPVSDLALEALFPALNGTLPVAIEADTAAQIDRALLVSRDYGLKPMLIGALQGYKRVDRLKGVPLVLGLNFGEEPKNDAKPAEATPDDSPSDSAEGFGERTRLYNEAARNAVVLQSAGLSFALSSHGSRDIGEFMSRLRAAVKNGLPRATALRALTVDAARIYGVERLLGTLEVGKVANVVAATGDFLDEKTKVKMLYIDGRRIDPDAKTLPPTPSRSFGIKERR
ncbi:hypothetical protein EON77_02320, partial [bacterium]